MELTDLGLKTSVAGLKEKKFSSLELVEAHLEAIKKHNKEINAYINIFEKKAKQQAELVDQKISKKEKVGFLAGLPIAIKDNILIKDELCTAGSKMLANYRAVYSATVIKKLEEAGAIFLGKTNMDEFAMGSSTETSYFGAVKNPHDHSRVPGGSSGGSAAAVAANLCLASLGSDTGGSIRQPASFCGVVGLKPTYGRVSRYGLMAMASSLDQIGPFTKTVEDALLLLQVLEGKDGKDSTSLASSRPLILETDKKYTIGVPQEYFEVDGLSPAVKIIIEKQIDFLSRQGHIIKKVSLPHTAYALPCYYLIMAAEVSANLARYDGIRYGFSVQGARDLLHTYLESRSQGFGEEVKRRILLGVYTLSSGYYDAYYLKAQKVRTLIKQDFDNIFKEVDCLLTPISPTAAFKIGEKINDPLQMYLSDIFTIPVNLAGLPAVSLPVGGVNGLPVGLQLIGAPFQEDIILSVGKILESSGHC